MSKRYHRNDLDEIDDEETADMLESRHTKVATSQSERHHKGHHGSDDGDFRPSDRKPNKPKKTRERPE